MNLIALLLGFVAGFVVGAFAGFNLQAALSAVSNMFGGGGGH